MEVNEMSLLLPSPFERLSVNINQPISVYIRMYHPTFSPAFPVTNLLSFLPLPSKLSLRLVSRTTKAWVDSAVPSVFSTFTVLYPLSDYSPEELSALRNTSSQCEHLTVTVSQYIPVPKPENAIPLPPFPRLTHLYLTAPDHDPCHALLSFRLALQRAYVPRLTHLTINNLSAPGILALRWGSFTSFSDADWTRANVWHGLTELHVKAVRWWQDEPQEQEQSQSYNHNPTQQEPEPQIAGVCKENWRTCTRVLHDWLHSFAANGQLRSFRFEWINTEGPNPFLLDELVSSDRRKEWFSAPGIRWTGLREVWLGNIVVSGLHVRRMKERMPGLGNLVVLPECLHAGLGGVRVVADGKVWVQLGVEGHRVGEWSEVRSPSSLAATRGSRRESLALGDRAERGRSWCRSPSLGDRASMVLPFMLDLSPED